MKAKGFFKVVANIGLAYGVAWILWCCALFFYADSAYESTGDFLPWWMNLNIKNPVILITGLACFIVFVWSSLARSKENRLSPK